MLVQVEMLWDLAAAEDEEESQIFHAVVVAAGQAGLGFVESLPCPRSTSP